jgi:hypothetical protein
MKALQLETAKSTTTTTDRVLSTALEPRQTEHASSCQNLAPALPLHCKLSLRHASIAEIRCIQLHNCAASGPPVLVLLSTDSSTAALAELNPHCCCSSSNELLF